MTDVEKEELEKVAEEYVRLVGRIVDEYLNHAHKIIIIAFCTDRRIVHIALYGKNHRIRKKNMDRALNLVYRMMKGVDET